MLQSRMAAENSNNPFALTGDGERCAKCSLGFTQRANVRSTRENLLFVLGASILRCSNCETRLAAWKGRRLYLNANGDNTFLIVSLAMFGGLFFCAAIALWALRRAHRWPF
jgi:hypothetical protein